MFIDMNALFVRSLSLPKIVLLANRYTLENAGADMFLQFRVSAVNAIGSSVSA